MVEEPLPSRHLAMSGAKYSCGRKLTHLKHEPRVPCPAQAPATGAVKTVV
ncbi:MAG TPA: hypothetical protein VEQ59_18645 [Polyangiaceae bacterium]|nr:hypothetical protein [Polyangiaceae bacterium]